jgi:hypothetical protein
MPLGCCCDKVVVVAAHLDSIPLLLEVQEASYDHPYLLAVGFVACISLFLLLGLVILSPLGW